MSLSDDVPAARTTLGEVLRGDADEDLAVLLLHRVRANGLRRRRAHRLPALQVEHAAVARTADALVDELARGKQTVQMRAVVGRRVRRAAQPRHRDLQFARVETADVALGNLAGTGDLDEFHACSSVVLGSSRWLSPAGSGPAPGLVRD